MRKSRRLTGCIVACAAVVALGFVTGAVGVTPGSSTPNAGAAGVASILRVNLITADVERLKRFYEQAFNFTVETEGVVGQGALADTIARQWSLPAGSKLYTVILRAPDGSTALGLTGVVGQKLQVLARTGAKEPPRGGDHYMILKVKNLPAIAAKLKEMGAEVWRPIMQVTGGQEMGVYDPDGTRLIVEEGAA